MRHYTRLNRSKTEHWRAFISYRRTSRRDRWLAHCLQARLEGYRTPKQLVRRGVEPRIGRVFIDDQELSSGSGLKDSLREAVSSSEHLIVICSADALPRTEGADYMQEEIAYFRSQASNTGRIFPVLSVGSPTVLEGMGVYREHDAVLALDMSSWRWWWPFRDLSEMLRIVAPLIGCSYAELRDRERRRARRRELTATILSAIFAAVSVFAGWNWIEAAKQRNRASERLSDVLALARHVFSVADQDLGRVHGTSEVRKRLTDASGDMVTRLLTEHEAANDITILRVRALGHTAAGDQAWAGGDVDRAVSEYQSALELDERLLDFDSTGVNRYSDLAVSHGKLARIAALQFDREALAEHAEKARLYAEKALRREPNDPRRICAMAAAYGNLATQAFMSGDINTARSYVDERMRFARRAALLDPSDSRIVAIPANAQMELAHLELKAGDVTEACAAATQAVKQYEALLVRFPTDPAIVRGLFMGKLTLGTAFAGMGSPDSAIRNLEEARVLAEDHLAKQPSDSESRTLLGFVEFQLTIANLKLGREGEARRAFARAVELTKDTSDPRAGVIQEIYEHARRELAEN